MPQEVIELLLFFYLLHCCRYVGQTEFNQSVNIGSGKFLLYSYTEAYVLQYVGYNLFINRMQVMYNMHNEYGKFVVPFIKHSMQYILEF